MSLQGGWGCGFGELLGFGVGHADGGEQVLLLWGELGDASHHLPVCRGRGLLLNALEGLQQPRGGFLPVGLLQPRAQHPVQDEREEADQRMGADAPGQTVVHRADLDVALERSEATLDVGQALVTGDDVLGWGVGVGHHQQLAVQPLQVLLARLVDAEAEELALEVDLDQVRQVRLFDRVVQTGLGAGV